MGSLPTSLIIEGRDLARVALTASSATPATFVNTAALVVVNSATSLCTRWNSFGALFQKWRVKKLRATLVSNQTTSTVGNNYVAFQTNADAAAPTTAEGIMRIEGSAMANAYSNVQSDFDSRTQLKWLATAFQADEDVTAAGNLNVATDGYSTAVVVGKVVIDYEIELADIL